MASSSTSAPAEPGPAAIDAEAIADRIADRLETFFAGIFAPPSPASPGPIAPIDVDDIPEPAVEHKGPGGWG